ncbi:MAG: hypothetical protein MR690_06915 [Rikenellaceae bacterium]|nr:hypothetical protein [Rikenellaceae bacterium]
MWSCNSETLSGQGIGRGYVSPEFYLVSADVECGAAGSQYEGLPGENLGDNDYENMPF